MPKFSANSLNKLTHAFKSDVQLLQCTIATASPVGVVTRSISVWTFSNAFSSTIIAKTEVPADTFPVLTATLFVATIPVPASPSGGHTGIPPFRFPLGSRSFAPSSVSTPACSPADNTFGRISVIFHEYPNGAIISSNVASIPAS